VEVPRAACDAPCTPTRGERAAAGGGVAQWPQKSELYILRSDGYSCTRETVQRERVGAGATGGVQHSAQWLAAAAPAARAPRRAGPPCLLLTRALQHSSPAANGNLQFACPSSQQQLLVWKTRPCRYAAARAPAAL
jgi:hypothetical protein